MNEKKLEVVEDLSLETEMQIPYLWMITENRVKALYSKYLKA